MSSNYPFQNLKDAATEFQALSFFWNSMMSRVRTAHPVQVKTVHGGGLGPIGIVDVLPLVNQVNGIGQGTPHQTVYGRPYIRWQGGSSAVVLDPAQGDKGLLVCCDRDISNVIATLSQALPGSLRRFNFADGVYVGCCASGVTPTQYVQFVPNGGGINIKSPGVINLNGAQVSAAGEITDGAGVVLGTHEHAAGTYTAPSGGGPVTGNSGAPT